MNTDVHKKISQGGDHMKIEAAQIEMRSQHSLSKTTTARIDFNDVFKQNFTLPRNETRTDIKSLIAEIIAGLREFLANQLVEFQQRYLFENQGSLVVKMPEQSELKHILDRLQELLSDKQIPYEVQPESPDGWLIVLIPGRNPAQGKILFPENSQPPGIQRRDSSTPALARDYQEIEKLSFNARGTVTTAGHRLIKFDTQLAQLREYESHEERKETQAKLADPLVLNFTPQLATIAPARYDFDINSDGKNEKITLVTPDSGLLALDLDHDQKITCGQELFGPSSGNGFLELTKYDVDHNGWIDSADPVFQELKIWSKDDSGNDQLSSLSGKGVGAICLENIFAPFEHKDQDNQLLGQSRQAGIFLREDGSAGTIQEVEFTV
jgi:hypothetical protein